MSKTVKLTPQEMITTATVGVRRWVSVLANGQRNRYSAKELGEGFERSIFSAMAEFVVAREFNLFWPDGVGRLDAGDVGRHDIEVRCRVIGGSGLDIGFKQTDDMDAPFVLVHADVLKFEFTMVGWMYGRDGWALGKENPSLPGVNFISPMVPPLRDMSELDALFARTAVVAPAVADA
jgi:hypothetical protein